MATEDYNALYDQASEAWVNENEDPMRVVDRKPELGDILWSQAYGGCKVICVDPLRGRFEGLTGPMSLEIKPWYTYLRRADGGSIFVPKIT